MRFKALMSAVLVTLPLGLVAAVAPAAPARAALPTCWTVGIFPWFANVIYQRPTNLGNDHNQCILRQGDHNNSAVWELQTVLKKCYGQNIRVDGDFGAATRAALINAQTWERNVNREPITVDGVYGPLTGDVMFWRAYQGGTELGGCYDPYPDNRYPN